MGIRLSTGAWTSARRVDTVTMTPTPQGFHTSTSTVTSGISAAQLFVAAVNQPPSLLIQAYAVRRRKQLVKFVR